MEIHFLLVFLLFLISICACKQVNYDEYGLYRLTPRTSASLAQLKRLEEDSEKQFWTNVKSVNVPVDILIPSYDIRKIEYLIKKYEIDAVLINSNIQEVLNEERNETTSGKFDWTDYYDLEEINLWLRNLEVKYPQYVKVKKIGETYEQRDILAVHLSFASFKPKKGIFIESNINAREWITSSVATYLLNEFLKSTDPEIRGFARNFDWYFIPIGNPDGFAYTKKFDRLWRKSRTPNSLACYGNDLQGNWGLQWQSNKSPINKCSENYKGATSLSDVTVKSIANYIEEIKNNLIGYISLQSNSQVTQHRIHKQMLEYYLKEENLYHQFVLKNKVGYIITAISSDTLGSVEWVKQIYQIPLAFSYVIRETGKYGCIVPSNLIIPTGNQVLSSLMTILRKYND